MTYSFLFLAPLFVSGQEFFSNLVGLNKVRLDSNADTEIIVSLLHVIFITYSVSSYIDTSQVLAIINYVLIIRRQN